ncbi:MAG TPA: AmmeMemoRadiSam system protein B [Tepidisphaeraceae bacterium]|nr:AmmeMemoRadiSam system protein B [Tepidisphaeraceae bacterium]
MAEPSQLLVRHPAVAGSFYPAEPEQCRALANSYTKVPQAQQSQRWFGGIVPHAGWAYSGAIAGHTLGAIATEFQPDLVVIFGAIHTPIPTDLSLLDSYARWVTPGDSCNVNDDVRRQVLENRALFAVDDRFHLREHAVEVELPLIRSVWPNVTILPIEVPANERAVQVGKTTARLVSAAGCNPVFLASSDLTHYGPAYGFAPAGTGINGLKWAKDNDRLLIDRVLRMQDESIVPEVRARLSACGGGAIAAMLAACKELGANHSHLLRHASSFDVAAQPGSQPPDNAVGYASIVVG